MTLKGCRYQEMDLIVGLIEILETNQALEKNDIQYVFMRSLLSCNMQMRLSDPSQTFALF